MFCVANFVYIFLWFTLYWSVVVSKERNCTSVPDCNCTIDTADCSNLSLRFVPKFTLNVKVINLSHNDITEFPKNGYLPKTTTILDLSYNKIKRFPNSSIKGLNILEELNLQNNRLDLSNDTYHPELFTNLWKLKKLNLKNNVGGNCSKIYPDRAFSKLILLEVLEIDGLNSEGFGVGFMQMTWLKTLNLSGDTGKCSISILTHKYFEHVPYLRTVDISNCKIMRIENGTFQTLQNLTYLDISRNKDLTFRVCENVTYDMQYTSIKILKLNSIHHDFGVGTELFIDDFKYLKNTSLEELYIEHNRLEVFEDHAPIYAPPLSLLSVGGNKLTFGLYLLELYFLKTLRVYNGSNQVPADIPNLKELLFRNKESCDINKRRHCDAYSSLGSTQSTQELDNTYSVFNAAMGQIKLGMDFTIPIPPNLQTVHHKRSRLNYQIPKLKFPSLNDVRYVDVSDNVLYRWEGPILYLRKLQYLDLSNNYCSFVSTYFFSDFPNLKTLRINDNLLGLTVHGDLYCHTFGRLRQLRYLDISGNYLKYFRQCVFNGLKKIEVLNISTNSLEEISFDVHQLKFLRYLDVSQNQLTTLPNTFRNSLDGLSRTTNITVDLSENRLSCSCYNLLFLKWLSKSMVKFKNIHNYTCMFTNRSVVMLDNLEELVLKMDIECSSKIGLIIGVLSAILVAIIIIISGIVYRYRWKLRYMYYTAKNRFHGYSNMKPQDYDEDFIYDAFISYADEDRRFVVQDMCKFLEQQGNCKLCIHHRDFLPGFEIASNITNSIQNSRKTIIVLSRNFLKSYWGMYEFNMARMESIYSRNGRNIVYLIFYDNLRAEELPLVLFEIVESQSYIEYPNDPQGNVVFWDNLKTSILN